MLGTKLEWIEGLFFSCTVSLLSPRLRKITAISRCLAIYIVHLSRSDEHHYLSSLRHLY